MSKTSHIVARHALSFVAAVTIATTVFCAVPAVITMARYGLNSGSFADMSGIVFLILAAMVGATVFVFLVFVAILSEFARRVVRPRIGLFLTLLLMSFCFFGMAFILPFVLLAAILHFESASAIATGVAIFLAPLGVAYWLVLEFSRWILPSDTELRERPGTGIKPAV